MLEDDVPRPAAWMGAGRYDDPGWVSGHRGYGTIVDAPHAATREHSDRGGYADPEDGGGTGFPVGRHADPGRGARSQYAPRHGKPRRSAGNTGLLAHGAGAGALAGRVLNGARSRAGMAALTATVVVGTGTTATVFSVIPLTSPRAPATPSAVITPPAAASVSQAAVSHAAMNSHPAQLRTAYVGRHRKPAAPTPSLTAVAAAPAGGAPARSGTQTSFAATHPTPEMPSSLPGSERASSSAQPARTTSAHQQSGGSTGYGSHPATSGSSGGASQGGVVGSVVGAVSGALGGL